MCRFAKQFLDAHEIDVREGKVENILDIETTTTELPTTTTTMEPTTMAPVVILVDDQPAPANTSVAPKTRKKGRRGRKRLPRSPRRGRPTRKRFRSRPRLAYMKAFLHDAHQTDGLRQRCIERILTLVTTAIFYQNAI